MKGCMLYKKNEVIFSKKYTFLNFQRNVRKSTMLLAVEEYFTYQVKG